MCLLAHACAHLLCGDGAASNDADARFSGALHALTRALLGSPLEVAAAGQVALSIGSGVSATPAVMIASSAAAASLRRVLGAQRALDARAERRIGPAPPSGVRSADEAEDAELEAFAMRR